VVDDTSGALGEIVDHGDPVRLVPDPEDGALVAASARRSRMGGRRHTREQIIVLREAELS
jgi:hypothetical protein